MVRWQPGPRRRRALPCRHTRNLLSPYCKPRTLGCSTHRGCVASQRRVANVLLTRRAAARCDSGAMRRCSPTVCPSKSHRAATPAASPATTVRPSMVQNSVKKSCPSWLRSRSRYARDPLEGWPARALFTPQSHLCTPLLVAHWLRVSCPTWFRVIERITTRCSKSH